MISDANKGIENVESLNTDPELRILAARVKFQQMREISSEIFKLKLGISKYECCLRNYLHILSGEMELHCNTDITKNVETILTKIGEGFSDKNWEEIISNILEIYRAIYEYCK